jgi:uncharacterized protein involved in type VI secretion and phage assembly
MITPLPLPSTTPLAPPTPPVLTTPSIAIEGRVGPLSAVDLQALVSIRVQAALSLPTLCELTFALGARPGAAEEFLSPGDPLRVLVAEAPDPLFDGQVTAVEYSYDSTLGAQLRVRAYDRLHTLRKRQNVRTYTQVKLPDLAAEFVRDLALRVQAAESGPLFATLIQHEQSNLDFLVEIAERCGLYLVVRSDVLHLFPLSGIGSEVPLMLGTSLLDARIERNADSVAETIQTLGWNPRRVEQHTGDARQERASHSVDGIPAGQVGADSTRRLVNESVEDRLHADTLSQAELDRRAARSVAFNGVARGDPRLQPGTPVDVRGVADAVAGRYVLTRVTHRIDGRGGFISELSSTPPAPHPRTRTSTATVGIVTQIADPDHLGRIRASLPTYGDAETDWMGVVVPGAGRGKGLIALPDVGDRVLVLLLEGNPAMGVVLGSLYGADAPPDYGIEGGGRQRFSFITAKGQRIQLDDSKDLLRVENRDGSYLELAPGKVKLHAATDLEIDAAGHKIVIRGQKIDFSEG